MSAPERKGQCAAVPLNHALTLAVVSPAKLICMHFPLCDFNSLLYYAEVSRRKRNPNLKILIHWENGNHQVFKTKEINTSPLINTLSSKFKRNTNFMTMLQS